jgi:hypothetical protein
MIADVRGENVLAVLKSTMCALREQTDEDGSEQWPSHLRAAPATTKPEMGLKEMFVAAPLKVLLETLALSHPYRENRYPWLATKAVSQPLERSAGGFRRGLSVDLHGHGDLGVTEDAHDLARVYIEGLREARRRYADRHGRRSQARRPL